MFLQGESVFERWWIDAKNTVQNADPVEFWAIVLIIVGMVCVILLVLFTEFKRKERDSTKFTVIMIVLGSFCLGLGIHMLLISYGTLGL